MFAIWFYLFYHYYLLMTYPYYVFEKQQGRMKYDLIIQSNNSLKSVIDSSLTRSNKNVNSV